MSDGGSDGGDDGDDSVCGNKGMLDRDGDGERGGANHTSRSRPSRSIEQAPSDREQWLLAGMHSAGCRNNENGDLNSR